MSAGTLTSGTETSGIETSGIETSGMETSGIDTSGIETSGIETSGIETSGTDASPLSTVVSVAGGTASVSSFRFCVRSPSCDSACDCTSPACESAWLWASCAWLIAELA